MDVLVIGGSVFLGRAMVSTALAAGADVTVFNRGTSGATPPGATQLTGDRTSAADLEQLRDRHFDLVIDTCGYVPRDVAMSADLLASQADHYVFVSSVNAYPGWPERREYWLEPTYDGDPDASRETVPADLDPAQSYGWLKVGCERAVIRAFGDERTTVLRAGCIVGPDDARVGRLPWWIDRVARGGEVLVPGDPSAPVSLVDARDLAAFALTHAAGVFETSGRDDTTRADLMSACLVATGSSATLTYLPDEWLAGQDVQAWTEIPLWVPDAEGPSAFRHHPDEALAAGFSWRPLTDTVADTWAWQQSLDEWRPSETTPGLPPEREAEFLSTWHAGLDR